MTSPPPVIVYTFDKNYAPFAAVSTLSLFQHATQKPRIYWIVPQIDLPNVDRVRALLQKNISVTIQLVGSNLKELLSWDTSHHFTPATFLRLAIQELIDEDRCIYLDADTLVLDDIGHLFRTDIKQSVFAGVDDPNGNKTTKLQRDVHDPYLNAGLLLMNLKLLREENMLKKVIELHEKYQDQLIWLDQCLINKYAEGRKHQLEPRWNRLIQANMTLETDFQDWVKPGASAVLHFVGGTKPWQAWCNPQIAQFWRAFADRLPLEGLSPTPLRKLDQALSLSYALDLNQRYAEASALKSKIITSLVEGTRAKG